MGEVGLAALACLFIALPAHAEDHPHRIASLNLCTDEMLVALADPGDIASLSPLARDPDLSLVAETAAGLPQNHGSAEEILRENSDLVLAETTAATPTVGLLKRLGVRVETVGMVQRLTEIAPTVRRIAGWLGQAERGEAMIRRMETTLAQIPKPVRPISALFYESSGWSVGPGTLTGDVLSAAGFINHASTLGLSGYGPLSLEAVVADPPDLLITERYRVGDISMAESWVDHPALRRAARRRLEIPTRLLICGTPEIANAVVQLARAAGPDIALE